MPQVARAGSSILAPGQVEAEEGFQVVSPTFIQPHSEEARAHARGFILALTLWVIALFGVGVAAISTWITMATDNAQTLRSRVDDEIALSDAKNELIYALATRPMTYRGLEVGTNEEQSSDKKDAPPADIFAAMSQAMQETSRFIAFDRRPYVMESNPDYIIQIQDGRGLINLNRIQPPLLRRLFALYDVPETLRAMLPDTLQDWTDEDDFTRLAGAEKEDYEQLRRLPPTNARLVTPVEAQNILGWDQIPKIWEDNLRTPIFSTCSTAGFNPNTAPEQSLIVHTPGLTEEAAKFVVERRERTAFRHAREFLEISNITVPNEAFFFGTSPGSCMVIDLVNRTTSERTRVSLTLVARGQNQPWQVDYAFRIPTQYRGTLDGLAPQHTFPTPETIAASADRPLTAAGLR